MDENYYPVTIQPPNMVTPVGVERVETCHSERTNSTTSLPSAMKSKDSNGRSMSLLQPSGMTTNGSLARLGPPAALPENGLKEEPTSFKEALSALEAEHDKEVSALRDELSQYRVMLNIHAPGTINLLDSEGGGGGGFGSDPQGGRQQKRRISWNPLVNADNSSDSDAEEEKLDKVDPLKASDGVSAVTASLTLGRRSSGTYARGLLPPTFEVLPSWNLNAVKMRNIPGRRSMRTSFSRSKISSFDSETQEKPRVIPKGRLAQYVWHPNSQRRLYWDLAGMILLCHDLIMIPFKTAFAPRDSGFYVVMLYVAAIFWIFDMFLSFFTGYFDRINHSQVVMEPKRIWRRYLLTWFSLDVLLVTFDILLLTIWKENDSDMDNTETTKLGRSLRTLRFLRSFRLLRLLKAKRVFQEIQDRIDSEIMSTYWAVTKVTLLIILANHVIACCWYGIGVAMDEGEGSKTWTRDAEIDQYDMNYRYTTAMHWSLTQFTPASMEVHPTNSTERLYTILVVLLAMITFSSFVSTLTSNMTHLRNRTANETRQFWMLRRYLKEHKVTKITSLRVQRYLEHAWRRSEQHVQERDVALLALLSKPLREDVKHETVHPHLAIHPLFQWMGENSRALTCALQMVSLASKDLYFACGQRAEQMMFVTDGELDYEVYADDECNPAQAVAGPSNSKNSVRSSISSTVSMPMQNKRSSSEEFMETDLCAKLTKQTWICEVVLWTPWLHLGDLTARTDAHLLTLNSQQFGEEVKKDSQLWTTLQKYGSLFVDELNKANKNLLTDLMDHHFSPKFILRKCAAIPQKMETDDATPTSLGSFTQQIFGALVKPNRPGVRQKTLQAFKDEAPRKE